MQNKKHLSFKVYSSFLALFLSVFFLSVITAGAIAKGYRTSDSQLKPGMVVELSSSDTNSSSPSVARADSSSKENVVGIVTTMEQSSLSIASSDQTILVETLGEVEAYISDLNGDIKTGDQLTLSPLKGILAKVVDGSTTHLGTALEDFPSSNYQTYDVEAQGGRKSVKVAKIRINLDAKNLANTQKVDSSLERLGRSVTGKDISEVRVIIALIIFLIALFAEGAILYGAISSSITSLGRNPMAKSTIRKELLQVIAVALFVLIIGLCAIYLVLWI